MSYHKKIFISVIFVIAMVAVAYTVEAYTGMAKINDEFIMLLNMDLIFSTDELSLLRDSSSDVQAEPDTAVEKKGTKK